MKKLIGAIIIAVLLYVTYRHFNGHQVGAPNLSKIQSNTNVSYKDGTYTGTVADAFYGNVQVQATVSGGKIASITFLQYPNDRSTSQSINSQAMPYLQQEAIAAQSAQVNVVSGATDTSDAFMQSLNSALTQAQS